MNKMNKKGFTLIEMLVVIAIIAVLVSIIVPVVGNATAKAAAATNAANLRAYASSVAIVYLNPGDAEITINDSTKEITIKSGTNVTAPSVPNSKKVGSIFTSETAAKAYLINGNVMASFGTAPTGTLADDQKASGTLEYFAYIAENGVAAK